MFHVNAWGLPYAACMTGAKLVFPGPGLDGKSLYELFEGERVTLSAGVPTVWQGLLAYVEANGLKFSTMRRTVIGGSACPPAMMTSFQERYDVKVLHAWGMTEMSPVGTVAALKSKHLDLPHDGAVRGPVEAGPRGLRRRHEDRRRRRQGAAVGRQGLRRADGARPVDRLEVLQGRRRRPAGPRRAGQRLVPDRRRRRDRPGRLHADHRPQQGRHQVGRRMDRLDRPREHRDGASEGRDGGLHRGRAQEVGRAAAADRDEEAGHRADEGRAARVLRRPHREVVDAR